MNTEQLIQAHFEKKAGNMIDALEERYQRILAFHEDKITAALLATSSFGVEELQMRLSRTNEIMQNPFGDGEMLHAITGLFILADGGPAEGAKAIQIYLPFMQAGIAFDSNKKRHLLALLAIVSKQARALAQTILEKMQSEDMSFEEAATAWLKAEQSRRMNADGEEMDLAYIMLCAMKNEIQLVFDEE